jgi:hypothetical protein
MVTMSRRLNRLWSLIVLVILIMVSFMTFAVVGAAVWLTYINPSPNPPPLSPRPDDKPILVPGPMDSDADLPPLMDLPDLSKVDRRIIEPSGLVNPRYCLLVFGPQAKSRVWIVVDGETVYVDRNGNGDLTKAGEAFAPDEHPESTLGGYHEWTYSLGDLAPGDQSEKHTGLTLDRYQDGDGPIHSVLSVWVDGVTLQCAGWGPLFTESRDTAPIVHFGGPVVAKPLRGSVLRVNTEHQELHFCVGTPGLGNDSFAYVGCEAVPADLHPVVEVAWPGGTGFKERFALIRRC